MISHVCGNDGASDAPVFSRRVAEAPVKQSIPARDGRQLADISVPRSTGSADRAASDGKTECRSLTATLTATSPRAASHAMIVPIAASETNSRNGLSYGDSEPAEASFPAWWSSTRQVADRVQPGRPWLGVPARSHPIAPGPDRLCAQHADRPRPSELPLTERPQFCSAASQTPCRSRHAARNARPDPPTARPPRDPRSPC